MEWKTASTELLGCKYPSLQSATESIGTWPFAAAVADTAAGSIKTIRDGRKGNTICLPLLRRRLPGNPVLLSHQGRRFLFHA